MVINSWLVLVCAFYIVLFAILVIIQKYHISNLREENSKLCEELEETQLFYIDELDRTYQSRDKYKEELKQEKEYIKQVKVVANSYCREFK